MLNVIGSLCVLLGGLLCRQTVMSERRRCRMTLDGMLLSLRQISEEIRLSRTPLPDLFAVCTGADQPDIKAFFQTIVFQLRSGTSVAETWKNALPLLPLTQPCLAILDELGQCLHGDEKAVTKALSLAVQRLNRERDILEQNRAQADQRLTALTLSAAALLVILFI